MKKVVFVDMLKKDFHSRGTEFEERQELYLPDEYDIMDWYDEQDEVTFTGNYNENHGIFMYEIMYPDYSTDLRVVHVIDVEQMDYNPEIDFPRD